MRRLFAVGAMLVTVGALILIMSAWYHGVVVGEYEKENPLDNSGPCEGMSQDVGTCNLLKSMESLGIPGWILIYVGSLVISVGITLWAIALRVPSQPQFQPISRSGEELCPFCVLSWLPQEQRAVQELQETGPEWGTDHGWVSGKRLSAHQAVI